MKNFKSIGLIFLVGVILLAQQPVLLQDPSTPTQRAAIGSTGALSVNHTQVNGVALGSPSNYGTSPGAVSVPGVNAFVTNAIQSSNVPQSTSTYALTDFDLSATAATQVKASAGNVYGFYGFNPNATTCYLQFYNSAAATLGTSTLHPFGVLAGASFVHVSPMALANYSTAISTGQTTTATGSTQCGSAMVITILYQ